MIKFNFFKNIKFSDKNFTIFFVAIFSLFIFIPVLVFAVYDTIDNGYRQIKNHGQDSRIVFWNSTTTPGVIETSTAGVCVHNSSDKDYFIPTKTLNEWNNFKTTILSNPGLGLSIVDYNSNLACIGDGACNITQVTNSYGVSVPVENYLTAPQDCADNFNCGTDLLLDPRDGKTYATTIINGRCWMAKNLNFGCSDAGGNCGGRGNHYTYAEALNGDTPADKAKGIYHETSTPATHD